MPSAYKRLLKTLRVATSKSPFVMYWSYVGDLSTNWGDKLNPYLAKRLTGQHPEHRPELFKMPGISTHYWIGSHLSNACSRRDAIIWGSGFISWDAAVTFRAKELRAVRGYLSKEKLAKAGVDVDNIPVGDPALLLPKLYSPKQSKKYEIGLIPHIHDRDTPFFRRAAHWPNAKIIDITGDIEQVVDEIASCKRVAASSLHGIICADAYGIPSLWLRVSSNVKGDGFKFLDYFSSVGRKVDRPFEPGCEARIEDLYEKFHDYQIEIDLDSLLAACPRKLR